jgi:uncharacterized protein YcaQ
MIEIKKPQDLARLRRLTLFSQGLLQAQAFGRGLAGAQQAISHLGYVQIDTISVVERAHHHVLQSRVPGFKPDMTNQLLLNGDIFEYWSHAAAFLPMEDYRFSLPYKNAIKGGQTHWYKTPDQKLMKALLARIKSDGPLRSRDLTVEAEDKTKRSGWWDLKPAKKALEQLYMQGDLMVSDRTGFQKQYDLTERVLPSHINTQVPSVKELAEHLLEQQLRCHGVVNLKGLIYLRRNKELRNTMKALLREKIAQGELEQVQVLAGDHTMAEKGASEYLIEAGALEHRQSRLNNRLLILSPFDNAVIQRDRLKDLFQYHYQIECYVPEAKRQYGYFSLPLLFRGEFIGRMDCKAHRKTRNLEIKSLHFEEHDFDEDLLFAAFVEAVDKFRVFQECDSVSLERVEPKGLAVDLRRALEQLG